jgi:hypothetical protein
MEKDKYIPPRSSNEMILNYSRYMGFFYELCPQRKCDHSAIKYIWDKINCVGKKSSLMNDLIEKLADKRKGIKPPKINMTCLEYLKSRV